MVQVARPQLPGYGGQAAPTPGAETIYTTENYPGAGNGNGGNGNGGGGGGAPKPFDGSFQIPNNFGGFVMLMMGLR